VAEREVVDARGMPCPGPLISLITALKGLAVGDEVEVLSSDRGSNKDIPTWLAKVGHELVSVEAFPEYCRFVAKKLK